MERRVGRPLRGFDHGVVHGKAFVCFGCLLIEPKLIWHLSEGERKAAIGAGNIWDFCTHPKISVKKLEIGKSVQHKTLAAPSIWKACYRFPLDELQAKPFKVWVLGLASRNCSSEREKCHFLDFHIENDTQHNFSQRHLRRRSYLQKESAFKLVSAYYNWRERGIRSLCWEWFCRVTMAEDSKPSALSFVMNTLLPPSDLSIELILIFTQKISNVILAAFTGGLEITREWTQ